LIFQGILALNTQKLFFEPAGTNNRYASISHRQTEKIVKYRGKSLDFQGVRRLLFFPTSELRFSTDNKGKRKFSVSPGEIIGFQEWGSGVS
jgi:hypothetical protein